MQSSAHIIHHEWTRGAKLSTSSLHNRDFKILHRQYTSDDEFSSLFLNLDMGLKSSCL